MSELAKCATTWAGDPEATDPRAGLVVTYHQTAIVRADKESILLDTGGYKTATTKKKMNQAARQFGLDFYVTQERGVWLVVVAGQISNEMKGATLQINRATGYAIYLV